MDIEEVEYRLTFARPEDDDWEQAKILKSRFYHSFIEYIEWRADFGEYLPGACCTPQGPS